MTEPARTEFGVYVHWPFCLSKCPYCDFNSHVRARIDEPRFAAALKTELAVMAARAGPREVTSVFFGGGTPSLMAPETVAAVLDAVALHFQIASDVEITLEANPTSVEAKRFVGFAKAGINRVSVGVQAFDDAALRFLGRKHNAQEARAALGLARKHFARVSLDLIYARPGQTSEAWRAELEQALALEPAHLSLYQLTFEPGTPMGTLHAKGRLGGLSDDDAAELYELTHALCADAGLLAYEVSNYAKPDHECRHNLLYWRYGDYIGLGPGAHGRIAGRATATIRTPEAWLAAVESSGHGLESDEALDHETRASEYLLMAMRLSEGASLARFCSLAGRPLAAVPTTELAEAGLLTIAGDKIAATAKGRLLLNHILARISA